MATPPERPALTRGWFHGWCQCGGNQLALTDVWPLLPYVKCADCGRVYQSVLAEWYANTDTEKGRRYISYRPMDWPFYLPHSAGFGHAYRIIWRRIREREAAGGVGS